MPIDDFHAGITAAAQQLDHSACPFAAAQNIDALAEDWQHNDPLISPAPNDKNKREHGDPGDKHIRANVQIRKQIDDTCENKGENAENQQQAEVDLPARRGAPRSIQVEVIREKQSEGGNACYLQQAVLIDKFVDQNDVSIRNQQTRGGQQK